jgi:class 3 adenylate cyclase/tetratricopeptide (TPR) repeat protein
MTCPKCSTPALPGSAFCTECGARLERRCPHCGADNPPGARFCRACGKPLEEARPLPERTPSTYTPRHLTEKVLTSRAALEGQRKQVTVLFIDVKSSQELARSVDPEVWHGVLDRYFEILGAGVHRFEGTINQYTGDGIMAIFGAPIAHEDHAQRACFAALALRDELAAFADDLRRRDGLNLSTRMGINSGEVVVGRIGDDLRMDYTAQGHTVGLAARMEALAEPGKIYLTKTTAALADGFFDLKDLGRFSIRGEPRSLRVYELRGVGRLRTRFEVARARGFSAFVGREPEMAILEEHLASALSGNGRSIGIVSEPGIGKSRLCFEFAARCRARGITVLEAVGVRHARSIPLLPIVELLRAFFAVAPETDAGVVRERVAKEASSLGDRFVGALPRLYELLRVEVSAPTPLPPTDPEVRERELLALVADLVRARSEREPLLLVAEDLPSYDPASAKVIAKLVAELPGTRTLLLVSRRTEQPVSLAVGPEYREIVLEPLLPESTRALVERLLGDHPSVAGLAHRIAERSEGNPLFIEEMIHALVASRDLTGEEGDYRATGTALELALPATVSALLDARIDALGEREKIVLQAASVLGKELSAAVLERIVELSAEETRAALDALCDVGLLRRSAAHATERRSLGDSILDFIDRLTGAADRSDDLYEFRHPLLQEVAYRSQLAQHRSSVHRDVARTLEGIDPERADERAGLIAHHLEYAGEALAAADWYARAARWQGTSDLAESFRCWQKARSLCSEVDETDESLTLLVRAGIQVLNLSWRLGIAEDEVETIFEETRAAAERSGRPDAIAGALGTFGIVRGMAGHVRESRARIQEATRLVRNADRPALEVALVSALAYAEASTGDLEVALASADYGLDLGGGDVALGADLAFFRPVVFLTALRGFVLIHLGRLEDARQALDRAEAISTPAVDAEVLGWINAWRVLLARASGLRDGALAEARRGLEIAERNGSPFSRVIALAYLGRAHALASQWPEAVDALERSLELARSRRTGLETEPAILADLAAALAHTGREEPALRLANEASQVARRRGLRLDEAFAELTLARVLLDTGGRSKRRPARKHLDRALELARATGARCLEAAVHSALARVAELSGDRAAREGELSLAQALHREVGADGHAARIAAELATRGSETHAPATAAEAAPPKPG